MQLWHGNKNLHALILQNKKYTIATVSFLTIRHYSAAEDEAGLWWQQSEMIHVWSVVHGEPRLSFVLLFIRINSTQALNTVSH